MSTLATIQNKLTARFAPIHLDVVNESSNHHVPPGSETHFKVTVVSERFAGQRLIARHRLVNETLAAELAGAVHALAIHTYTADEWEIRRSAAPTSPDCAGGGAAHDASDDVLSLRCDRRSAAAGR
ncbi:MAG: BolA/IbaG family iron-sulfur metabolism protein [Gammaproteobacteria bacterium]|nr:BolA/IbaG family iron-sulfur metabolism protein [Gammaproteobacteria bacterium]